MDRKYETFYVTGKRDAIVCVEAVLYENGVIVANAKEDHITQGQLMKALTKEYPGYRFNCEPNSYGYWLADGEVKDAKS